MRFSLSAAAVLAACLIGSVLAAPAPSLGEFAAKKEQGLRLLTFSEDSDPVWKTEAEKLDLMRQEVRFVSIPLLDTCCIQTLNDENVV
jgi:hypothetical protein